MNKAADAQFYEKLTRSLPSGVAGALELVSVPHWVDDSLATRIVSRFGDANGTTANAIATVKMLPLVSPHGSKGWRVADPAREHFHNQLVAKTDLYKALSNDLAEYFRELSATFVNQRVPLAREADWRSLYHRAPTSPREALADLEGFVERAAAVDRLSDMKAAVRLTESQRSWLAGLDAEVAYIVGRYAYVRRDWDTAESRFLTVWETDTDFHRRIVSGHLLGVIWSGRSREPWWSRAEKTLTNAADLARREQDKWGEAMILTTLGSVQTRLGGNERLAEAESALRRSLELRAALGGADDALGLSALAALLVRRGGRPRLLEAERLLRAALHAPRGVGQESMSDRLAQVLLRLGDAARLAEAETLLRERIRVSDDDFELAVTRNTLAAVLLRRGTREDLREAEDAIRESIEGGRRTGNRRHVAMALLTGSWIAERRGDMALAISRQEEMIQINRGLGLTREVARAEERLAKLRDLEA